MMAGACSQKILSSYIKKQAAFSAHSFRILPPLRGVSRGIHFVHIGLRFTHQQFQQPLKEKEMNPRASTTDDYEVFLSFKGPDTRQGFTDVLYDCMDMAGIRVFRDDDELAIGDQIDKILEAINSSQICVPIFSKTFAQSKWCLKEVRKMLDLNKVVVPIFYDVTPYDVKLKTPVYRELTANHELDEVQGWRRALKTIAKIKGREVLDTKCSFLQVS